jgi:uncharacterized protein (DUF58 family)
MLTKQFGGEQAGHYWLDWSLLSRHDYETRLSILCRWVLDAEGLGISYGLRLPGVEIPPARGEEHMHLCLASLARFDGAGAS